MLGGTSAASVAKIKASPSRLGLLVGVGGAGADVAGQVLGAAVRSRRFGVSRAVSWFYGSQAGTEAYSNAKP